jgi:DNA-binding MarR family transcriptional regulator
VSTARFDEIIHPSTRLSIVALLASTDWADFSFVRDRLGMSDSALSKQFSILEDAGYVTIERLVTNRRRRVRVGLTDVGRQAFEGHVAALQSVIAIAEAATP